MDKRKDTKECLHLIQLVRNNPCIWDRTHPFHNNADHVKATWISIAEQLDYTLEKTRARWKNLRDSYRLQLYKKVEAIENNDTKEAERSWPFFEEMSFLEEHMYRKTSPQNKKKSPKLELITENIDIVERDDTSIRHIEMVTVDDFDTSVLDYLNQSDSQNSSAPLKKQSILVHSNRSSADPLEDEDRCFFDSLLPYMKLLPPKDKMMCRMRIQEVIFSIAFPAGKKETAASQEVLRNRKGIIESFRKVLNSILYHKEGPITKTRRL